jgi:hypothetical protein
MIWSWEELGGLAFEKVYVPQLDSIVVVTIALH